MAHAGVPPKTKQTFSPTYVRRVISSYAKSQGWVTHRLMIEQHVLGCLQNPDGMLQTMIRHYEIIASRRRHNRKLWSCAVIGCMGIAVGIRCWLA